MPDKTPFLRAEVDKDDLKRATAELKMTAKMIDVAKIGAVNDTAKWGRTRVKEKLTAELGVRPKAVMAALSMYKASKKRPEALIGARPRWINLIEFGARQTGSGVTSKKMQVAHAFIAQALSKKKMVFKRTGEKRIMTKGRYKGKKREAMIGIFGPLSPTKIRESAEPIFNSLRPQLEWYLKRRILARFELASQKKGAAP